MTGAISNGLLEMIRFVTSRNSSVNELYFCRTSTEWQIFLCFCILLPLLVAWFILFLKYSTSTWMRDSPHAQPPTWKTRFFSRLFESTGHSPFASLSAAEQWDYCRRRYQGLPEMIYWLAAPILLSTSENPTLQIKLKSGNKNLSGRAWIKDNDSPPPLGSDRKREYRPGTKSLSGPFLGLHATFYSSQPLPI